MNVGFAIRLYRKRRWISQESLAQKAKMSRAALAMIESGETPNPRLDSLQKIAAALGVEVWEMLREATLYD